MSAHLTFYSGALMNYITADYAVSVFPQTTFLNCILLLSCQEKFPGVDDAMTRADNWLREYNGGRGKFEAVGAARRVYQDVESGDRWIGNPRCWIIQCLPNS